MMNFKNINSNLNCLKSNLNLNPTKPLLGLKQHMKKSVEIMKKLLSKTSKQPNSSQNEICFTKRYSDFFEQAETQHEDLNHFL